MKSVIVLRGLPGSGKSTHATQLAEGARARGLTTAMVSADDFFVEIGGGTFAFDVTKLAEAHGTCFRRFLDFLAAGTALVVVDNTNTSAVEISPYMLAAQAFGYEAKIVELACTVAAATSRNQHGVPAASIAAMAALLETESLPGWWTVEHIDVP
jgi:predicted kinase